MEKASGRLALKMRQPNRLERQLGCLGREKEKERGRVQESERGNGR